MTVSSQRAWGCSSLALGAPPCGPSLYNALPGLPFKRKMVEGLENLPHEKAQKEGVMSFLTEKEKDHHNIHTVLGQQKGEQRLPFHKEPNGEDKRQWVQIAQGEDSSWHKKGIFYRKNNPSLEGPPQSS